MPKTINEKILDSQIDHAVNTERYKANLSRRMIALLNQSEENLIDEIAKRLVKIEERGFDLGPATTKRLTALLEAIRKERVAVYEDLDGQLSLELEAFAEYESEFQIQMPESHGIIADFVSPTTAQLAAIVTKQPFQGGILKEWADGLAEAEVKRIKVVIQTGMVEGQTVDQMVRRIRGTRAGQYGDGILEIGRRDAQAVVLTAVSHVQNRTRETLFEANADIVEAEQFRATLDSRTTLFCASHDGKVYNRGEKKPALPAHWRCRSFYVAYFKADKVGLRSSENGAVPASMTFEDFLNGKDAKYQDAYLGPARGKLFRSGTALDKFIDKSGETYTLKELKARERA